MRICKYVARVIHERESSTNVPYRLVLTLKQFLALHASRRHIVEGDGRTEIKVIGKPEEECCFNLRLPSLQLTFVVIIIAHFISHSPCIRRKREEIQGICKSVFVLWKDIRSPNTQ